MTVSVQFIEGLDEEISNISLRKKRNSNTKTVVLMFDNLKAMDNFRSFTNKIENLWLRDEEGDIKVIPSGIKFFSSDNEQLSKVECAFEVDSEEVFERVMRFFNRYAEAKGFEFQSRGN